MIQVNELEGCEGSDHRGSGKNGILVREFLGEAPGRMELEARFLESLEGTEAGGRPEMAAASEEFPPGRERQEARREGVGDGAEGALQLGGEGDIHERRWRGDWAEERVASDGYMGGLGIRRGWVT